MGEPPESKLGSLVCKGPFGEVQFARMRWLVPGQTVWEEQSLVWQAKFGALFEKITSNPNLQLQNVQQFKQVEGKLFEFKRNDVKSRIFAFRKGMCWYLVHCFTSKKEDDLPPSEVSMALRLMEEGMGVLEVQSNRSAKR